MKNGNDLFSKPKKVKNKNPNLKYIILSFSLFIVILSAFSVFLFMRSLDFDFNNIIDRTNTEEPSDTPTNDVQTYSVSELSGKSVYLLMLTDDSSNADFGFIITADFDSKEMSVASFDANQKLSDGKTYGNIYGTEFISGLKSRLNADFNVSIDKYIICTASQFKRIIASLGGVTVNVAEDVNYKSSEFNVSLDKGTQKLSDEYAYKYLAISETHEKSRIMCDMLASALTPENSEKSDDLFKIFVNNCKTDISVIDYSNSLEKLKIYSNAEDRFYPSVKG
ncbi:MAG: LCP family protein [Oscillospiraceae bacterium]|nr:LCP family protein [Oscillospiraceae bacterium]